jgi:predicted TIM-barrel fold metal-dependent hydrolase
MMDRAPRSESIRPVVLEVIDIFGVDRCMFASNYPVDMLFTSYASIWNAYDEITADFSDSDRERLFMTNGERYYRI